MVSIVKFSKAIASFVVVLGMVCLVSVPVPVNSVDTATSGSITTTGDKKLRQLQIFGTPAPTSAPIFQGPPTEVLYLNIMRVDRNSALDDGTRQYYNVRARVRIVNQSATGLSQGDIINFDSYVINGAGTNSPVLVRDDSCIFAKLALFNGRYVLADGNNSLKYEDRGVCWIHDDTPKGPILSLFLSILQLLIPGWRK